MNQPMIAEFRGEIPPETRRYQIRRLRKRMGITMTLVMSVLYGLAWFVMDWTSYLLVYALLGVLFALSVAVCVLFPASKGDRDKMFPRRICFTADEYQTIRIEGETFRTEEYPESIRRVIDKGDFYYLDLPHRSGHGYTCQKSLLTEGSIEAFEQLFEGKIVKKVIR